QRQPDLVVRVGLEVIHQPARAAEVLLHQAGDVLVAQIRGSATGEPESTYRDKATRRGKAGAVHQGASWGQMGCGLSRGEHRGFRATFSKAHGARKRVTRGNRSARSSRVSPSLAAAADGVSPRRTRPVRAASAHARLELIGPPAWTAPVQSARWS